MHATWSCLALAHLRHIVVVDENNYAVGIVTRRDLAHAAGSRLGRWAWPWAGMCIHIGKGAWQWLHLLKRQSAIEPVAVSREYVGPPTWSLPLLLLLLLAAGSAPVGSRVQWSWMPCWSGTCRECEAVVLTKHSQPPGRHTFVPCRHAALLLVLSWSMKTTPTPARDGRIDRNSCRQLISG